MSKLSEARRRANKKWDENNKEARKVINARSAAKGFVKKYANFKDLEEIQVLINERRKVLEESSD